MNTMIVVAEKEKRETLQEKLCSIQPSARVVALAGTVSEGLACFLDEDFEIPDLIFCGSNFPDGTFIDFFSNIYDPFPVIWLSEKEINPPPGLLSLTIGHIAGWPDADKIINAISRYNVLKHLLFNSVNDNRTFLPDASRHSPLYQKQEKKTLIVKKNKEFRKLLVPDIICIFLWSRVTVVLSKEGERFSGLTNLAGFERTLPCGSFFRITRTMIVNIEIIESFRTLKDGRIRVLLNLPKAAGTTMQVLVSKENAGAFRKWAGM